MPRAAWRMKTLALCVAIAVVSSTLESEDLSDLPSSEVRMLCYSLPPQPTLSLWLHPDPQPAARCCTYSEG